MNKMLWMLMVGVGLGCSMLAGPAQAQTPEQWGQWGSNSLQDQLRQTEIHREIDREAERNRQWSEQRARDQEQREYRQQQETLRQHEQGMRDAEDYARKQRESYQRR